MAQFRRTQVKFASRTSTTGEKKASPSTTVHLQRMIRLLGCVEARSLFNAIELSRTLGVSRRTVFRDLNLLRAAGLHVFYDEAAGGYTLPKVFAVRRRPLRDRDLELIVLAVSLSVVHVIPGLGAATQEALATFLSTCDPQSSIHATRLAKSCRTDLQSSSSVSVNSDLVISICHAIYLQRQIRVTMIGSAQNRGRQTKVSPYRLVAGTDGWSLIGRSTVDRRTVAINIVQIEQIELTDDTYTIPRGFREHFKSGRRPPLEL